MKHLFFIGTMNRPADLSSFPFSDGISVATLNDEDGIMESLQTKTVARLESPTFLGMHPTLPVLYACSSVISGEGFDKEDILTAYRVHSDGTLTQISQVVSGGKNPCHICVHPSGKWLFSPNYSTGTTACVFLNKDGGFSDIQYWQHPAKGSDLLVSPTAVTGRQESSHPHGCTVSPDGRFVMECDLGCDRIWIWTAKKRDKDLTKWELSEVQPFVETARGSGPRHAMFSRMRDRLYVFTELACSLDIFDFDSENGRLSFRQSIPVLSDGYFGQGAEIVQHPSADFLYLSTRIANRITVFRETEKGVEIVQSISAGGEIPRFIHFDPTGKFLVSCCQKTGRIVSFSVSATDGTLATTSFSLHAPWCACVCFTNSN